MRYTIRISSLLLAVMMAFTCVFSTTVAFAEDEQAEEIKEIVINLPSGCTSDDICDALLTERDANIPLIVNVPDGTYKMNRQMCLYSNTTINSSKNAKYILKSGKTLIGTNNYACYYDEAKDEFIDLDKGGYNFVTNVTINGGDFDGNNVGGEIIRFIHASNITVKNIKLHNVGNGGHHLTLAGVKNATVSGSEFYGYNGTTAKEAIHLDIVYDETFVPGTPCYDDLPCNTITIKKCNFHDLSRGVGSHGLVNRVFTKNVTITENTFKNITDSAIKVCNYYNSKITNNTITNAGKGIFVHTKVSADAFKTAHSKTKLDTLPNKDSNYSYKITVQGNKITNAKSSAKTGRGIEICGNSSYKLGGVTVKSNTIETPQQYGIFLNEACYNNTVSSNKINKSGDNGIQLYKANSNTVSSNTVTTAGKIGISLSTNCGSNKVESNTIKTPKNNGIQLYSSCNSNKINSNTITTPANHGISVSNSSASNMLYKNKITSAKGNGISINKAAKNEVSTNTIESCAGIGVCVTDDCTSTSIRYNTINKPTKNGIYVRKSKSVQIKSNTMKNCKKAGAISLANCTSPSLTNNSFSSTTKTPIYFNSCSKANTSAMSVATVNGIGTKTTKVTGKAGKSGSTVTVKIGSKSYKASVSKNRSYSAKIPKQKKGTTITVIEKDKQGNNQTLTKKVS